MNSADCTGLIASHGGRPVLIVWRQLVNFVNQRAEREFGCDFDWLREGFAQSETVDALCEVIEKGASMCGGSLGWFRVTGLGGKRSDGV
jgi:hypothetical protein